MPLAGKLNPKDGKNTTLNLNGTDRPQLNQYFYNCSFTCLDGLRFLVQNEKNEQMPFSVTNLTTVHTVVFTYQPINYDWYVSPKSLYSRYLIDKGYSFDEHSWSVFLEKISLVCDDKADELLLECHNPSLPVLR